MSTTTARVGVTVHCMHYGVPGSGYRHTSYRGLRGKAPKRAKCEGCGGRLIVTPTVWGAVDWRGDGRYERPEVTYPTPELARAACMGEQVERPFTVD